MTGRCAEHRRRSSGCTPRWTAHDGEAMAACYAPRRDVHRPGLRRADRRRAAGHVADADRPRPADLPVELVEHEADGEEWGTARWIARYTFGQTGRPVVNDVRSELRFDAAGLIVDAARRVRLLALGPAGARAGRPAARLDAGAASTRSATRPAAGLAAFRDTLTDPAQRKAQPARWSLTMPVACIRAYAVVGPTNRKPLRFKLLRHRGRLGGDGRRRRPVSAVPAGRRRGANDQSSSSRPPSRATTARALAMVASTFARLRTMPASASSRVDVVVVERRHRGGVEAGERRPERLALAQDRDPGQPGLERLEADPLEEPRRRRAPAGPTRRRGTASSRACRRPTGSGPARPAR